MREDEYLFQLPGEGEGVQRVGGVRGDTRLDRGGRNELDLAQQRETVFVELHSKCVKRRNRS